ncbi:hypothetical protein [Frigoribacterium sp. SL97]|uniref:hypothetical protein n=1 Tax=Frigoribacterium sp. SL97 TaxID=2994664 RepID=UPI0022718894|nr:hypothetical protein [Frigoribacterium sp. SL97]WAC50283.1 hypothetical protein OVA02_10310 [Frigoribacterium sp. SL97]
MSTFTESEHPRVANGTFTDKEQTAPELSLTSEPEKSHLEAIYDIYIADGGYGPQVARQLAEQHLNDADEAGVPRQYLVDYLDTFGNNRAWSVPNARDLHAAGWTPAEAKALIDYDGNSNLARSWHSGHFERLIEANLHPERIDALVTAGVPKRYDALVALGHLEPDEAAAWVVAARANKDLVRLAGGNWEGLGQLVRSGISREDAARYAGTGIDLETVISHRDRITPEEAAAFSAASGHKPDVVSRYLRHNADTPREDNLDAATAKAYGTRLHPSEVLELVNAGVSGKVARSIIAADQDLGPKTIIRLTKAGVTSGKEFKQWRELTKPRMGSAVGSGRASDINPYSQRNSSYVERVIGGKESGVALETAEHYVAAKLYDPEHWKALNTAGITDITDWAEVTRENHRTNDADLYGHPGGREDLVVHGFAAFKNAGGTPDELRRIQRVGVPIGIAHTFIGVDNLWDAAEKHRTAVLAAESDRVTRWGGTPSPWHWTAADVA